MAKAVTHKPTSAAAQMRREEKGTHAVTVIVVHLRKHIDRVGVKGQIRVIYDPKGIQLVPQSALSEHELRCVCAVETVHTIGPANPVLQKHLATPNRAVCVLCVFHQRDTSTGN
jgi:hypothetical protein